MSDMEQYDESIKAAVEREAKRRKRMLTGYLALLIVSMTIGGFAVVKAPAETTVIAAKVEPIVRDHVQAAVAEAVTSDVVTMSEPRIDKKISSTFTTTVEPRLDAIVVNTSSLTASLNAIDQQVDSIGSTVVSNSEFIETARPQIGQIADLRATVNTTIETIRSMDETFAKRSELQEGIATERAARQTETQGLLAKERASLRNEMQALLANEQSQIREAIRDDVRKQVQGELQKVWQQIESLEKRIAELEGRPPKS